MCCDLPVSITIALRFVLIDKIFQIGKQNQLVACSSTWSLWQQYWNQVCLFIRLCFFPESSCLFPSHQLRLQCCLHPGPTISVFLLGSVQPIRVQFCDIHLVRGLSLKVIICDQSQLSANGIEWLALPYASYSSLYADAVCSTGSHPQTRRRPYTTG